MTAIAALEQIAALADFLRTNPAGLDASVSTALTEKLDLYLCEDVRIEAALDLVPAGIDPRVLFKIERRNMLLCRAAALLAETGNSARAKRLHSELLRYFTSASWKSERTLPSCPHKPGTLKAELWAVLKSYPDVPGTSTIRQLLPTPSPFALSAKRHMVEQSSTKEEKNAARRQNEASPAGSQRSIREDYPQEGHCLLRKS